MDNWGQRMLAMSIVWAIPCASIWSIVPVISGMFFTWWQTMLVCLGILAYVVVTMIIVSKVFSKKLSPKETRSGMIMELPPYHKAHWKHIFKEAFLKAWDIFKRAMGTVTLVSVLFYVLSFSKDGNVDNSLLYRLGTAIEPVTKFFGMGWQTFMAFVSGAFAKEAVLGTLNAVFMGDSSLLDATFFSKTSGTDTDMLGSAMSNSINPAEALAFMFATTFNIPCIMALSTTYKESHSLKWTVKIALFYVGNALMLSCIVYHIASIFV
jgi:ferrous iron transport protein B